jgi:integrase
MQKTNTIYMGQFHPANKIDVGERSFTRGLDAGYMTEDDVKLIKSWTSEMRSTHQISDVRVLKYYTTLCGIKRALPDVPIRQWTILDIHQCIETLKTQPNTKGRNYSQNSLHDHIVFLKRFCYWLIENEIVHIPLKKIKDIRPPSVRYDTTDADELFTDQDLKQLISGATDLRDIALIYILYESGGRAAEIARLRWKHAIFDEYGIRLYVNDTKNETKRYVRLTMATEALARLKDTCEGTPLPDDFIFTTNRGEPLTYPAMCAILKRAAKRGGLDKKVRPHLFRKTRITDMIRANFQESTIKEALWGNVATDMFKTYLRLNETDTDREFLKRAGVDLEETELGEAPILKPIPCSRCHYVNQPTGKFCSKCGAPLGEMVQTMTDVTQEIEQAMKINGIEETIKEMLAKMGLDISKLQ